MDPMNIQDAKLLSPKAGDFLVIRVETDEQAEYAADAVQQWFSEGLDPKVNICILPPGMSIDLLTDEQLDGYGLVRTEEDEGPGDPQPSS